MWKLLILITVFNQSGYAGTDLQTGEIKKTLMTAKLTLEKAKGFESKREVLLKLKRQFVKRDQSLSREQVKKNRKEYHSLSIALSTFEIINLLELNKKNCKDALNKIEVSYDPQNQKKPDLPDIAKLIFNLMTDSCNSDF